MLLKLNGINPSKFLHSQKFSRVKGKYNMRLMDALAQHTEEGRRGLR